MAHLVSLGEACHGRLQEVTLSGSRALRLGCSTHVRSERFVRNSTLTVAILNTGHLKHPLARRRRDDAGTTGRGDESTHD